MDAPPSLSLLASQVADELSWQERRGDALDSKAGVVLGFAGVLAGLSLARLNGDLGRVGLAAAALAAMTAGAAFVPRSLPGLDIAHLRAAYLGRDPTETQMSVLTAQLATHTDTQQALVQKTRLVRAAVAALGFAVVLVVLGAILGGGGRP